MKRSKSSKQWLKEHDQDPYVKLAKKEGYRARSAYKLIELDEKDKLLKKGMFVVDLGAAPGGWAQVAAQKVGDTGHVFALDILPMDTLADVTIIQGDFRKQEVLDELMAAVQNHKIGLVISDMAPNISGVSAVDINKAMHLADLSLDMAKQVLKPDGAFVVKVFQGEGFDVFFKELNGLFKQVHTRKPKASRPRSKEVYLVAKGFIGEKTS